MRLYNLKDLIYIQISLILLVLSPFILPLQIKSQMVFYTNHLSESIQISATSSNTYKRIVVNLSDEELTAYEGSKIIVQTPVTTGGPATPTPLGVYHVTAKLHNFVMHSPWPYYDWRWYPDSFVNYGLLYDYGGYFIHDAPWRSNFGPGSNTSYGTPGGNYTGTHGCINVPYSAEIQLYNWASIGTTVIVES